MDKQQFLDRISREFWDSEWTQEEMDAYDKYIFLPHIKRRLTFLNFMHGEGFLHVMHDSCTQNCLECGGSKELFIKADQKLWACQCKLDEFWRKEGMDFISDKELNQRLGEI